MTGRDLERVALDLGEHADTLGRDLSGVAAHGDALLLAPDEGRALLRLRRTGDGWGSGALLPLDDAVDLPGDADDEVDAEGLEIDGGVLWVAGSHSAKRKRVKDHTAPDEVADRLADVEPEKPRRLLARIPLVDGPDGVRLAARDEDADGLGVPARLPAGKRGLLGALDGDPHLGPFLTIPGKDNGLDVEGVAVAGPEDGRRVLLGLRGPVLRGWAVIVALAPGPDGSEDSGGSELALGPVTKHFLDLGGLGVRDLVRDGDDLLVLAGPTMVLDGPNRILRLPGGGRDGLPPAVRAADLELVAELPVGEGADKPEGLAVVDEGLLLVHDTPAEHRIDGGVVHADLLPR